MVQFNQLEIKICYLINRSQVKELTVEVNETGSVHQMFYLSSIKA